MFNSDALIFISLFVNEWLFIFVLFSYFRFHPQWLYIVCFATGDHQIDICYFGQSIPDSPFCAKVWDASKVVVAPITSARVGLQSSFCSTFISNARVRHKPNNKLQPRISTRSKALKISDFFWLLKLCVAFKRYYQQILMCWVIWNKLNHQVKPGQRPAKVLSKTVFFKVILFPRVKRLNFL